MSNVSNDPNVRQSTGISEISRQPADIQDKSRATPSGPATTQGDLAGVSAKPSQQTPAPITTVIMPAYANATTEAEVLAALDKVSGKSPEVQKAVAEAAAALAAVNAAAGNALTSNILGGLTQSLANAVDAAKNNLGAPFAALYQQVGKGLDEILAASPESVPLRTAADSARTIMDTLQSGSAYENKALLAKQMNDLLQLTKVTENATAEQKAAAAVAAALYNVLSVVSELDSLGDKLTDLLGRIGIQFPQLKLLPDAVAASGNLTNKALLGLTMLLTAQLQQELAVQNNTKDEETKKTLDAQNIRTQNRKDAEATEARRASLAKETQAVSSSEVVNAFSQCGEIALAIVNELILQRQIDSVPRDHV